MTDPLLSPTHTHCLTIVQPAQGAVWATLTGPQRRRQLDQLLAAMVRDRVLDAAQARYLADTFARYQARRAA